MIGQAVVGVHARQEIEPLLVRNAALHVHEVGDLDNCRRSYGPVCSDSSDVPKAVLLLYLRVAAPVLLVLSEHEELALLGELPAGSIPLLPNRLNTRLTRGPEAGLPDHYVLRSKGLCRRMVLQNRERLLAFNRACCWAPETRRPKL